MQVGNKFRIYPDRSQQKMLLRWIGCQRFIYNAKVAEDRYFRTFARKSLALCGVLPPIDQKYSQFVSIETAFLREVPSQVLRNGAYRWRGAYQRYFAKLAGRPKFRKKHGRQSVLLTRELFSLAVEDKRLRLTVGTKKCFVGKIRVVTHNPAEKDRPLPGMIAICVDAGRWFVSFNVDNELPEPNEAAIAARLMKMNEPELLRQTVGIDRGVVIPAMASTGQAFDFSGIQRQRLQRAERYRKRFQRIAARREKGSKRRRKALDKAARCQRFQRNVRTDFAHKTSRTLVDLPGAQLFAVEDLKVRNMTASARGTVESPGQNVKQKAGLNRAILESAWGQTKQYLHYKAPRAGKLAVTVPPHRSSQEYRACGHTHPGNRPSQAAFVCLCCGHVENADLNAAKVIRQRGVTRLLAGEIQFKEPRKSGIRSNARLRKSGQTRDGSARSYARGEDVSRQRPRSPAQPSPNRETPTTTVPTV
ncbi:MAG: transposase [Deltaproteobacteria bacterium]|nr:transposase [Deltaproteobacteria bacterium]